MLQKKALGPEEKKALMRFMVKGHGVSLHQACQAVSLPRSSYQYQPKQKDDTPIIEQLKTWWKNILP